MELNKDEKFTRGGKKKKSDEPSDVNCFIYLGLSPGTEGTKESQLVKGSVFHTSVFFPHKDEHRRKWAGSKAPLSLSLHPSPFSPHCPEGIWGHLYPKIYRNIKEKKKKGPEDPISFIKETAHTRSDDNGANLIPWLLPRTDIMLRNVCLL